jgi:hypothetical protein
MVEVAICEDKLTDDYYEDVAVLRHAGPLWRLLDADFGTRVVEQDPLVTCHPPVSLRVS